MMQPWCPTRRSAPYSFTVTFDDLAEMEALTEIVNTITWTK